jgi:hypothetical protein
MINILSHFGFEKNSELIKELNKERSINKIIETGGIEHTPIDKFSSLPAYSEEEIEKDKKTVEKTYKKFESRDQEMANDRLEDLEKSRKRGEALEIALTHLIERWFQHDDLEVLTQRTTEFDDVVNGTDIIVEFKTPDSIEKVAMTVDASLHIRGIRKKLRKCIQKMTGKGDKLQVKYFQSQFEDENGDHRHGPLKNIISLVSGFGPYNADHLFEDFADYLQLRDNHPDQAEEKMEQLAENPLKKIFIKEIEKQIEYYIDNEEKLRPGLIDELKKINRIIKEISKEADSIICNFKESDDSVLNEIDEFKEKN